MRTSDRILLVEDDEIDAETVRRALRDLGANNSLEHVSHGEQALSRLHDATITLPGLIILDLNMPRMNGIELLHQLRGDPALRKLSVVVLTTSNEASDRSKAFDRQVSGYFLKPIDYPEFVVIMKKILDYWLASEEPT